MGRGTVITSVDKEMYYQYVKAKEELSKYDDDEDYYWSHGGECGRDTVEEQIDDLSSRLYEDEVNIGHWSKPNCGDIVNFFCKYNPHDGDVVITHKLYKELSKEGLLVDNQPKMIENSLKSKVRICVFTTNS